MQEPTQYDYVLRGGDRGAERLALLAAVKWPTTETLFRQVGLRRKWTASMSAAASGPSWSRWPRSWGKIAGSWGSTLMNAASNWLARKPFASDCLFSSEPGPSANLMETAAFDFVFARFVLTHLREPENALHQMVQAARPGGVVVVEDIEFAGHFCHPACPAFERYVSLYQQVVRHRGGDPNIGPRLLGMFQDAGLSQIRLELVQPTYHDGPGKRIAQVTMEHIREAVVGSGLASDAEIDDVVAELDSFANDPRTIMSLPRIFQVWGKR